MKRTDINLTLRRLPNAMRIRRQTVSLPIPAKLTDEDVVDVIESVKGILR